MKLTGTLVLTALLGPLGWAQAQMQLLPDAQAPVVFGGGAREIEIRWHNPGEAITTTEIRARIFQTSSASAVLLSDAPWKQLEILPQQTVLESATLDFPAVKAETKFLVQWLENTNRVLGTTTVWIYPTNLLAELRPMLNGDELGVYDPQNELKPLLKGLSLNLVNLEDSGLDHFSGKLAIIGPFPSRAQMPDGLAKRIKTLARHGSAVVWLLPPAEKRNQLSPSFYSVMAGTNAVVVAQADLVSNLPENPQAQLNLVSLCKLALKPAPLALPNLTPQP